MSFKFKLGEIVRKIDDPEETPFRVIGLLLEGRINIRSLKTHRARIAEGADYETVVTPPPDVKY